jgi:hypothetical protein
MINGSQEGSQNYAIQGATSSDVLSTELPTAEQRTTAGFRAGVGIVTLTVGADDINFSKCMRDEFEFHPDSCVAGDINNLQLSTGTSHQLSALSRNLSAIFVQIHRDYPNARIVVTGYYQPFPGPVAGGGSACNLMVLPLLKAWADNLGGIGAAAAIATLTSLLNNLNYNESLFQQRFYRIATFLQGQLDNAIAKSVPASSSMMRVEMVALDSFQGHDMCQGANSWVFAPRVIVDIATVNLHLDLQTQDCPYPANGTEVFLPSHFPYDLGFAIFFSNCISHPVVAGQQGIAQAIASSPLVSG